MKARIVEQLGQTDVLLPTLISEGLAANDRIKVRMSALQAAVDHAGHLEAAATDLSTDCRAAGVDAAAIQSFVEGARLAEDGRLSAPTLAATITDVLDDAATMIRAVAAVDAREGVSATARLEAMRAQQALEPSEAVDARQLAGWTAVPATGGDSLHRLVMDLHKAINRYAAAHAEERVGEARTFGLRPEDRGAVTAFMRGLDRTRPLKFDHPGLDTLAIQSAGRLLIQNDLGTTDAHVVVVAVEGNSVTVTYTDVHRARARFFTRLFTDLPIQWTGLDRRSADGLADESTFYAVTGHCAADGAKQRDQVLEALGGALVFLIDWNKARKVLRNWVAKDDAIRVLDWAARSGVGHRGFLELGGSDLVASAVRHATPNRIGFGERLDSALGREPAVDFLKAVLKVSAEALLEGRSVRLARDRIEADLVRHLERTDSALLSIVVRQSGLARDIAAAVAHYVAGVRAGRRPDGSALAACARRIEEKADKIAFEARSAVARFEAGSVIGQLVDRAEEAIDELEQAAFIASLLPDEVGADALQALADLAGAALAATEAAAAGAEAAAEVPEGRRVDSEDALAAVGRLVDAEHSADDYERAVTTLVLRGGLDLKTSIALLELARALERTTDRLAGFGHLLRQHVLTGLAA